MESLNFQPIDDIRPRKQSAPNTISLTNNDRPLSQEEIDAEERAEKFSLRGFGRISPVPGTLGYLYRNLRGGNDAVIEHLRNASTTNKAKFINNFLIIWNNLDKFSRRRVDIFDILCNKYNIPRAKFWGIIQEGMFESNNALSQIALSGHKPEFVELLKRQMAKEKNAGDRKLFAEIVGLVDQKPLINVEDNSQHLTVNNNQSPIPSFTRSMSRAEQGIKKGLPSAQVKQLGEGKQDYIDAEIIRETKNGELIERKTPEQELEEAVRDL